MNIYSTSNQRLCELLDVEYNPNEVHTEPNIEPFENCRGGYFDMTGIPQSEEHKRARSEALKNNVNCGHMKGKTWSEETKRKMSESAKLRNQNPEYIRKQSESKNHMKTEYLVISPTGQTFEVFGINQFCKNNDLAHSAMVAVAKGKRKHHKNWKCEYKSVVLVQQ